MHNIIFHDEQLPRRLTKRFESLSYLLEITTAPAETDSLWNVIKENETTSIAERLLQGEKFVFRVTGIGKTPVVVHSEELFDSCL